MKKPKPLPRRSYDTRELMRAAYMAGQGASAGDIVDEIGETTPERIYAALNGAGLRLTAKTPHQVVVNLVVSKKAVVEAEKIAAVRRCDVTAVMARLLEYALEDRCLALNLLDDAG